MGQYKINLNKMKKQGILMPETLKIILAVVGIGLLVTASVSFAGIFIKTNKITQAETSLNLIKEKMGFLSTGEDIKVILTSPKDWYLLKMEKEGVPHLCICEKIVVDEKEQIKVCEDDGVCQSLASKVVITDSESQSDGAFIAKKNAIKIRINDVVIEMKGDVFYLTDGVGEVKLKNIFGKFLSEKIVLPELSEEVKKLKGSDKIVDVRSLSKTLCAEKVFDDPRDKQGDFTKRVDSFFKDKISNDEYITFQFKRQIDDKLDLFEGKDLGPLQKIFYYSDGKVKSYYSAEIKELGKFAIYEAISLDDGKYCIVYVTSNKEDWKNEK